MGGKQGAIVLGGNFVGLGVVRSLGCRGIPVWVFDTNRSKSIAQFSRYTKRFVESTADTCALLLEEGRRHHLDGWVVFPVTDEYVEAVSTHHQSLSSMFRLTTAPPDVTKFALDKRLTYQRAAELGVDAPWTLVVGTLAELRGRQLPYPMILKPAVNHRFFPHTNVKALSVSTPEEFQQRFSQMRQYLPAEEILIQEKIPGGGENQFSFCGACKDGRVYATLVARRRRQYPLEFGNASSFVETVSQPVVEEHGRRFLEGIGFDGIAEVEFKFDPRDGKFKILDVNIRAWGWHTLGKAAGVDFIDYAWRDKTGEALPPAQRPRQAAWLREMTDLVAIAKSPSKVAEIRLVLQALLSGRVTLAAFDLFDPVPFFAEFALWASKGSSRQAKARDFVAATTKSEVSSVKSEVSSAPLRPSDITLET